VSLTVTPFGAQITNLALPLTATSQRRRRTCAKNEGPRTDGIIDYDETPASLCYTVD
jgi:hypothetical protein